MRVSARTKNLTLNRLHHELQKKFPDYRFLVFGRTLMVQKSLLEGCGVVIKSGSVSIQPLPASFSALAITSALFALMVIPGFVFLLLLFAKSRHLVKDVGAAVERQM